MPGVYVGETKSLVFPMLCDGYIKLEYLEMNPTDTDLSLREGVWSPRNTFTLEAIITPYDVNGYGSYTTGQGTLDSQKTSPRLGATESNKNHYQSNKRFGTSQNNQKMSIFYNTNLHLYLENTTTTNINQPSEWRLVADFPQATTETRYVKTPTVISSHNTLHGYYDETAWYDGISTSRRRITTSSGGATPTATILCNRHTDIPSDTAAVQAAGSIQCTDYSTLPAYATAANATGSITIANQSNFKVDVAPSVNVANSGQVKFGAIPDSATDSDLTEYIQVTNEDGTVVTRWFAIDGATNGDELTDGNWPSNSYSYERSTTDTIIASNFAASINRYNAGWSGSASSGADPLDSQPSPPSICTLFTGGIAGSAPNRKCAEADITLGSGLPGGISRVQPAGGTNEIIRGESTGSADTDINYISIMNSATDTKNYMPSETKTTGITGTRTLDDSSTVSVVYFNWGGVNQNSNCATALAAAINHANGHPSTITATTNSAVVNLSHDIIGTAGNSATIVKTNTADSVATISGANFTGGVNFNDPTQYVTITGSSTDKYKFLVNGDVKNNGHSLGEEYTLVKVGTSNESCMENFELAIEANSQGIGMADSGTTRAVTRLSAGAAGNNGTPSKTGSVSGLTVTAMTGGADYITVNEYISIYDAAGVEKKYKGVKQSGGSGYSTGQLVGGYVHYQISTTAGSGGIIATMNNLRTAILSTDGHGSSITVTPTDSSATRTLTIGAGGSEQNNTLQGTWPEVSSVKSFTLQTWQTTTTSNITLSSGEAANIGVGEIIYNSTGATVGEVLSVSGDTLTMTSQPTNRTSTLYASQPREALYVDSVFKVTLIYNDITGKVELYLNNSLQKSSTISITDTNANDYKFEFADSDCKIGQGTDNTTQFYGELYEIAMSNKANPSLTSTTLSPGLSDIIFYYRFDEHDS